MVCSSKNGLVSNFLVDICIVVTFMKSSNTLTASYFQDIALRAFTEVVQQQPDEGDAWANVAAVHMYRKNPEKAYHALQEVRRMCNDE